MTDTTFNKTDFMAARLRIEDGRYSSIGPISALWFGWDVEASGQTSDVHLIRNEGFNDGTSRVVSKLIRNNSYLNFV